MEQIKTSTTKKNDMKTLTEQEQLAAVRAHAKGDDKMKTYKVGKYELTEGQFFGREEIAGDLYLDHLTELPEGFSPVVGGDLFLGGLAELPSDFAPKVGGDLWLDGLEELPPDFAPTVGGELFLDDGIDELPEGFAPNVRWV